MNAEKRAKLEAAGFVTTSVEDFLGLTPEESRYIELKLRLAERVKQERVQKSLTQADFAKRIKSSQSRVAKMEKGDPSVSLDLLFRSLFALDVNQQELGVLVTV